MSFTVPKMYSCYSLQISQKGEIKEIPLPMAEPLFAFSCWFTPVFPNAVESVKGWVCETWSACSYKKIVAASATMAFWNLSTIKTRILTGDHILVPNRKLKKHLIVFFCEELVFDATWFADCSIHINRYSPVLSAKFATETWRSWGCGKRTTRWTAPSTSTCCCREKITGWVSSHHRIFFIEWTRWETNGGCCICTLEWRSCIEVKKKKLS